VPGERKRSLFLPFLALEGCLDLYSSCHELMTRDLEALGNFALEARSLCAAETLLRFLEKTLCVGAVAVATVLGRVERNVAQ
jgi:hypothetical protein